MQQGNELCGLELEDALSRLREKGIQPQITYTRAPRGEIAPGALARVVRVGKEGKCLTAAYFVDKIGMPTT